MEIRQENVYFKLGFANLRCVFAKSLITLFIAKQSFMPSPQAQYH